MKLAYTVSNLDAVPEELRDYYSQDPETQEYVLQASGAVSRDRLDEFRSNNNNLLKQNKTLLSEIEKAKKDLESFAKNQGSDSSQQTSQSSVAHDADRKAGADPQNNQFMAQMSEMQKRIDAMQRENEKKVKEAEEKAKAAEADRDKLILDRFIDETAAKLNVEPGALDLVRMKAREVFKLGDDRRPIAMDSDGFPILDTDSGKQWTGDSWMESFRAKNPFAFKGSTGGGAVGGRYKSGNTISMGQDPTADQIEKIASGEIMVVD